MTPFTARTASFASVAIARGPKKPPINIGIFLFLAMQLISPLKVRSELLRSRQGTVGIASDTTQTPTQKDGGCGEGQDGQVQLNGKVIEAHVSLQKKTYATTFDEVRAALAAVKGMRVREDHSFCLGLALNVTDKTEFVNLQLLQGISDELV